MSNHARISALAAAILAGSAWAATVSVNGPASATPGGDVTLIVSLPDDLTGVYALQGALTYDPVALTPLETDAIQPQAFHAGAAAPFPGETIPRDADLFRMNAQAPGTLIFAYVKNPSSPAASPAAAIPPAALSVTFRVAAGASGQTQVALAPYTVNGQAMPAVILGDVNGDPIAAEAGAAHTLALTLRGDADGDGEITMTDVLLAMQAASGLPLDGGALRVDNADVWPPGQPDGHVTMEDALRIGRFLAGLETDLN